MAFSHGLPKLMRIGELSQSFPDPLGLGSTLSVGLAIFAELFCSLAVMLGIGTRLAAVPVIITMLVAAFIIHAADPWAKKELALLYAVIFTTLFFTGAGRFRLKLSKLEGWS